MKFLKLGVSTVIVFIFSACSDSNVNGVKNGVMKNFSQSLTVGQAIDSWSKTQKCDTTKWEAFKSDRGEKIVSFKCSIEKESSLSTVGLNTQSILQSHDIKDVNAVYSKLEDNIENYESKKQELNQGMAKLEADKAETMKMLEDELFLVQEKEDSLKAQVEDAKNEIPKLDKAYQSSRNWQAPPNDETRRKDKEYQQIRKEAYEHYQNLEREYYEVHRNKERILSNKQSTFSRLDSNINREKERVKESINAMNVSIEKGKKDVQKIEMTSDVLEQLKKVNLIIQFTLSADGKSFVPSYEGVEYSFKDSKMYAQDIATSTQVIMMGVEVLKRFGGFGGTGGLLTSAYLDKAYKVEFRPEFYEQRK